MTDECYQREAYLGGIYPGSESDRAANLRNKNDFTVQIPKHAPTKVI
jgi:hypothetical protein